VFLIKKNKSAEFLNKNEGWRITMSFDLLNLWNMYSIIFFAIVLILFGLIMSKLGLLISSNKPISVNYHFTRDCNYKCGFCFHTKTNDNIKHLELDEAKRGIKLLISSGTRKLNFAGGEPFLYPKFLGSLVKYCKEQGLESVSIVSNASKLKHSWFKIYGKYIDVLAVSCDSINEETNILIGRRNKRMKNTHLYNIENASKLCNEFGIKFKINSVICSYNYTEDMNNLISRLNPYRWKVFQVLKLNNENGEQIDRFLITKEQFQVFVNNHSNQKCMIVESNNVMQNSYLILDEKMRFLDCSTGDKIPTQSILDVGVKSALEQIQFDSTSFIERKGVYDWKRLIKPSECNKNIIDW
jgi:radical S-adenosyl methionine domain-containing protein 2